VKGPQEVINGLFFRPEIAEQFGRVNREPRTLFSYEFLDGRMTRTRIPLSYPLACAWLLHDQLTSP
jgi:hypothetical protein